MTEGRRRILLLVVLAVALALRVGHWLAVRTAPFVGELIVDSKEYDAWARQIANGDWLGSQVLFQAPLYPYLLASVYSLVGRSLDAVYLLQIVLSVSGVWALFRAAQLMGGDRIGIFTASLAAIYGPFLFYDVQILKESLAVTAMCFLLWAIAEARLQSRPSNWLVTGVLLGILVLLRENAFLLTPVLLALVLRRGDTLRPALLRGGALLLGLVLTLIPVAVRNGWVGGDFTPTTSQGGVNFYIGNNAEADGTYVPVVPGKQIPSLERQESIRLAEAAVGRKLSAAEASSYWMKQALNWIGSHPLDYLELQARKLGMFWSWYEWPDSVDYYWIRSQSPVFRLPLIEFSTISLLSIAGLWVLWRRARLGAFAPAWSIGLGWMLATIAFFLFSRYRLPGIPTLMVLSAVPLVAVYEAKRAGDRRWRWGAVAAGAAVLVSLVPGGRPRIDLVEFNLGRLAEERNDTGEAERHYKAALADNPRTFLACMNLGTIAARRQDWPAALAYYEQAEAIEPRSDDVQCDIGGVFLAMGRTSEAAVHLDRALALNSQNLGALQNKAVLLARSGNLAEAQDLNRRLLELDPQNAAGLRMRDRLATDGR